MFSSRRTERTDERSDTLGLEFDSYWQVFDALDKWMVSFKADLVNNHKPLHIDAGRKVTYNAALQAVETTGGDQQDQSIPVGATSFIYGGSDMIDLQRLKGLTERCLNIISYDKFFPMLEHTWIKGVDGELIRSCSIHVVPLQTWNPVMLHTVLPFLHEPQPLPKPPVPEPYRKAKKVSGGALKKGDGTAIDHGSRAGLAESDPFTDSPVPIAIPVAQIVSAVDSETAVDSTPPAAVFEETLLDSVHLEHMQIADGVATETATACHVTWNGNASVHDRSVRYIKAAHPDVLAHMALITARALHEDNGQSAGVNIPGSGLILSVPIAPDILDTNKYLFVPVAVWKEQIIFAVVVNLCQVSARSTVLH